jgi:hypothetical protein
VNRLKIVVFGEPGDDHVNVRDRTADVAFGGEGNDTAVADPGNLDVLNGFESIDRTLNAVPPPVTPPTSPLRRLASLTIRARSHAERPRAAQSLVSSLTMTRCVPTEQRRWQLRSQRRAPLKSSVRSYLASMARAQRAEQVRIAAPTAHPASAPAVGDARTW